MYDAQVCRDYVELFSMNVNLKVFCIPSLCIILCDTSKASENLTYFETKSSVFVVIYIYCVGAMKIKESAEQIVMFLRN